MFHVKTALFNLLRSPEVKESPATLFIAALLKLIWSWNLIIFHIINMCSYPGNHFAAEEALFLCTVVMPVKALLGMLF